MGIWFFLGFAISCLFPDLRTWTEGTRFQRLTTFDWEEMAADCRQMLLQNNQIICSYSGFSPSAELPNITQTQPIPFQNIYGNFYEILQRDQKLLQNTLQYLLFIFHLQVKRIDSQPKSALFKNIKGMKNILFRLSCSAWLRQTHTHHIFQLKCQMVTIIISIGRCYCQTPTGSPLIFATEMRSPRDHPGQARLVSPLFVCLCVDHQPATQTTKGARERERENCEGEKKPCTKLVVPAPHNT